MASASDQSGKGERTEAKRLKRKRTKKEAIAKWPTRKEDKRGSDRQVAKAEKDLYFRAGRNIWNVEY